MRVQKKAKKILPLGLLVEGRSCLVVGGGTVAGRKAKALIEAGAEVTLVAPELGEWAKGLRSATGLKVFERMYDPEDLDGGFFLVFAATDDHALNQQIIQACRARGILCACPDRGWEKGDFISPASFREGDVTVSVSTGGAACRRSRLIKEHLARHVATLGKTEMIVLGTDHHVANLAERESLHLAGPRFEQMGMMFRQVQGLHEFMLLNTCNRVELIGLASAPLLTSGVLNRVLGLDRLEGRYYVYEGRDAFRHVALVVAGLLSQTPGETHICAQVKAALDRSFTAGWAAGVLKDWISRALHIGKVIRQVTAPLLRGHNIEDLCQTYLQSELGILQDRRILVLGAGPIGKGIAEKLASQGALVTCCYHVNMPVFSAAWAGRVKNCQFSDLHCVLRHQDAIVCATGGGKPVLTTEHARMIDTVRRLIVVDLGVPRNTTPGFAAEAAGVTVVDIDGLETHWQDEVFDMKNVMEESDRIVAEHFGEYERIIASIQSGFEGQPACPGSNAGSN